MSLGCPSLLWSNLSLNIHHVCRGGELVCSVFLSLPRPRAPGGFASLSADRRHLYDPPPSQEIENKRQRKSWYKLILPNCTRSHIEIFFPSHEPNPSGWFLHYFPRRTESGSSGLCSALIRDPEFAEKRAWNRSGKRLVTSPKRSWPSWYVRGNGCRNSENSLGLNVKHLMLW